MESASFLSIKTKSDFRKKVQSSTKPTVVLFQTSWSGDAFMVNMMLEQIVREYKDQVQFCIIDVEKSPSLKEQYAITKIPTTLFFKQGQLVGQIIKILPRIVLKKRFSSYLGLSQVA